MEENRFEVRVCVNPLCGLRYTLERDPGLAERCPKCRSDSVRAGEPFGQADVPEGAWEPRGPVLEVLLDNIRSAWNVGSMFRAADGAGVGHIYLGGVSPTPDQPKVAKTALGSEMYVPWSYCPDGVEVCRKMKDAGYRIWALEGGRTAEGLYSVVIPTDRPLLLVVGNEITGVDPGILAECERVVCLPMSGQKGSLNVAVAFGVAVYALRFGSGSEDHQSGGGERK